YRPTNADGTLGNAIVFSYDLTKRSVTSTAAIVLPTPAAPPALGLSIAGIQGEIALDALSENASHPANGLPGFSDFNLELGASAADPGLLALLVSGRSIGTPTIHVRNAAGQEYLTYTLTRATVTGLAENVSAGALSDGLSLGFAQVSESYRPTNADG